MSRPTHRLARLVTLFVLCLCLMQEAGARAGGAGGYSGESSHSYGGGGYGGGGFSIHSPNYYGGGGSGGTFGSGNFIILFIFIILIIIVWSRMQNQDDGVTAQPIGELPEESELLRQIRASDPGFDLTAFREKVARAFILIQQAWSAQDISRVRTFISDGIYQRYSTQFQMMQLLKQRNEISDIHIHLIQPVAAWIDGPYQVIEVQITARMVDRFISQMEPSLNEEGDGMFTEYWSFIRRLDPSKHGSDLTNPENCPSCGAALPPNMGEICRCEHCQVMINSGDFDWLLCEITQQEDHDRNYFPEHTQPDLHDRLTRLNQEAPDFSVALIEDKASNAMMQICSAYSRGKIEGIRRFVSDAEFEGLKRGMPNPPHAYSRLFLNDVSLLAVNRTEKSHQLRLGLVLTRQRVRLSSQDSPDLLDSSPMRSLLLMDMERDISAAPPVGSLYQHQCPCCGGAIADTTDTRCVYCGSELNSPSYEWIVTGLETRSPL